MLTEEEKKVVDACREMSDDEWRRLLDKFREMDPGFFDVLKGIAYPGGMSGPLNGVQAANPPQHETGSLSQRAGRQQP